MNTNHKQALEILAPMHKDFDSYMFEPEIKGWVCKDNVLSNVFYIHNHTYEKGYEYDSSEWVVMVDDGNLWRTRELNCKDGIQPFYQIFQYYLPTDRQLWAEILKFNEEQKSYGLLKTVHYTKVALQLNFNRFRFRGEFYSYTDTDSLFLCLLKVCVKIWEIRQETSNA